MKAVRFLLATGLALCALAGLMIALAPEEALGAPSAPPGKAKLLARRPAAPLGLPLPYLSDNDVADAPYDNPPAPTVDGLISPGEYAGAGKVTFPGYGGDVEVFFKQDGANLYVAFDLPDKVNHVPVPQVSLLVDTLDNGGGAPQPDDFWFMVYRNGGANEWQGAGGVWAPVMLPVTWTHGVTETMSGWSVEFSFPFGKLNILGGGFRTLGLALGNGGIAPADHFWPGGAAPARPDTWGSLVSSSDWGMFYWKPGPWEGYAPSGMPDFDQMQVGASYCGPFAMANSLWWFDSKFEEHPAGPTPTLPINDSYPLVQPYGNWDDHDPQNVISFTQVLGKYFKTDALQPGTNIYDMYTGLQRYLRDQNLWDDYVVTLVNQPEFRWIADEAMRSEDVVLLLGFYQEFPPGSWYRIGGHYVTVAGVAPNGFQLAISDPARDFAETGGAGRVLSGTLIPHFPIPHTGVYTLHNDAGNVSHDVYHVIPSTSPGGLWALEGYEPPFLNPIGLNPNPKWTEPPLPWQGGPIHAEIEYALAVSPYDWKASGRWVEDETTPLYGRRFVPYNDFAPSGLPDFDQKQDAWWLPGPGGPQWSHCGPVAAADSLWWFDSKFEFNGLTPPAISDTYPLVQAYGAWDDHDPQNIQPFVNDLAARSGTNMLGSGTTITGLYSGVETYIIDHGLRQGYVITKVNKPEFWWVAEEVERSEDVILLLGFYAEPMPGVYERVGGHYVALPGVDKQGGFVAFSDPYWDRMEDKLPPREFQRYPWWSGRVGSDGDTPLGPTGLLPTYTHVITHSGVYTLHNDAANISHDVYRVRSTNSPGGVWGPDGYVDTTDEITNFFGVNGPGVFMPGTPVQTEVEWALAVSPVADLGVTKSATPAVAAPGEWVTFTIVYTNYGNLAEDVVITDLIPTGLVNAGVMGTWNSYGGAVVTYDTFTWTVGDIPWMGWGVITITAQVDPNNDWVDGAVITNTVEITTTTTEQYQVPAWPNSASVTFTVQSADVSIIKATPLIWISAPRPGDWITFTLAYANLGSATARSVVITDLLPTPPFTTTGARYTYTNGYGGALAAIPGLTFAWDAGDLPAYGRGVITLAAQVDPDLTHGGRFTNTAEIATVTFDRDLSNNWDDFSFSICVPPDGAHFTYTPAIPVVNQPVTFTGGVTRGEPVDYAWDFGDPTAPGPSPTGNPVTHTYSAAGFYTVWMTATSQLPLCGQDMYSETIFVCQPPSGAGIAYAPAEPLLNETVLFTATASGSGPLTYTWRADDGWTAGGVTATHAFTARGLHTVWLTATNACGQAMTATRVFVSEYAFHLTPQQDTQSSNPGQTLTYTLAIHNDGNVTDTYDLTRTLSAWPTALSVPTLTVRPGRVGGFRVYVTIPSTATNGASDVVTVTATSRGDPSQSDFSVLTSVAVTQVITRGVELAPPTAAQSGAPGDDVVYRLVVTNTGSVTDIIHLTVAANWPRNFIPHNIQLGAGMSSPVIVTVTIPGGASNGDFDVATVTAQAIGASATSTLTTTAVIAPSYGVDLTPDAAAEWRRNGETAIYTFTVENTGSVSDSFTLALTDDDWPTALSTSTVGPILPGGAATFQAVVTVPLTAPGSTFDRATVTASSAASPTVSDASTFTTTVSEEYAHRLTPASDSRTDNPGRTVTYTLTVHNDGNVTDTYTLSHTPTLWSTALSTGALTIAPWNADTFQVYVTIPVSAPNGARDVVTVSAASSGPLGTIADAVLTTIATTQTITRGVELAPPAAAQSGAPGEDVVYQLIVTNTGSVTDTVTFGLAALWPTVVNLRSVQLGAEMSSPVIVTVTIPLTAANGEFDIATVTAQATGVSATSTLTTTAVTCVPPAGASFTYTPPIPLVNRPVTFTGSVTQGAPVSYDWNFGGMLPVIITGNPVSHTYTDDGYHTITMTARNLCGQDVYSGMIFVCRPAGGASIAYAPAEPLLNETVLFTATASGSGPLTYTWRADDGWTAGGVTATHAFADRGAHTIWLTATNACGQAVTDTLIFIRAYGVDVQPSSGEATGKQGVWITYTLTLFNTGNVTDSYTVSRAVTGQPWPTTVTPTLVGPLPAGGSAQLYVTIYITSSSGSSYATIAAASVGDPAQQATAVLTTTSTTQPIVRGVEIAPPAAAQTGDVGTTVTYTLRVTNTGNVNDFFNLAISGPAWGTTLSVYGLSLSPGEGRSLTAYVTIPAGASQGDQDTATVTARSAGDPAVADSAILTTTARVPPRGVELTPSTAQQIGHPGDVVTYTLTVRNTGERDDSFTLSQTASAWTTTLSAANVGPLAPQATAQVSVTVRIPTGVLSGAFDVARVTATSQGDPAQSDTSVLTTTAISQTEPITRGVTLTATITALEGKPGAWVTYTLRLTNTGNAADFFNLSRSGNAWPADLSVYGMSLAAGAGADVLAYVQIPLTAHLGDSDTVTIRATSANDATATASVALTTSVRRFAIYLPAVMRNYP